MRTGPDSVGLSLFLFFRHRVLQIPAAAATASSSAAEAAGNDRTAAAGRSDRKRAASQQTNRKPEKRKRPLIGQRVLRVWNGRARVVRCGSAKEGLVVLVTLVGLPATEKPCRDEDARVVVVSNGSLINRQCCCVRAATLFLGLGSFVLVHFCGRLT